MKKLTKLERFEDKVLSRYDIYNNIFLTLPFESVNQTGKLLPVFSNHCYNGYKKKFSPFKIVSSFFEKHCKNYQNFKNINFHFKIDESIFRLANCIMSDVFNSMNDKEDKESILKNFQVNNEVMSKLPETAVFMHCLPAKIGSEVTNDVIKGSQSIVMQQAKNRMFVQQGILNYCLT